MLRFDVRLGDMRGVLREIECTMIATAWAMAKGNRAMAARILGVNRTTLLMRMKGLGMGQVATGHAQRFEQPE